MRQLQYELEVHRIELEMQNDELRASRLEIEAALEQYTELYDFAPTGYFSLTAAGVIRTVNLTGAKFAGLKRAHLIGKPFARLLVADDRETFGVFLAGVFATGEAGNCDVTLASRTPQFFHVDGKLAPGGKMVLISLLEITERQLATALLRKSEARFRAYIDQAADAIFVHDFLGRFREVNSQACISLGYTREELLRMTVMDVETDFSLVQARAAWEQVAIGEKKMLSGHHRCKNGSIFPVEVNFGTFELDGERWFLGVARDISDRVRTEIELHQLKQSIAAAANGIFLVKPTGEIFWANDAFTRMTGYTAAEVIGKTPRLLKSGEHNSDFYRQMWQTVLNGNIWQGEIVNRRKDGVLYNENKTITPVLDAAGKLAHFICVQEDITEKKKVQDALQASNGWFSGLIESTSDWVWEVNARGEYTFASARVKDLLGFEPEEIIGRTPFDLMPPDEAGRVGALFGEIAAGRKPFASLENINLHKDGRTLVLETSGVPFFNAQGELAGYRGYDRDITARKKAEAQLQASEERYRKLVENAQDLIFILAPDGTFVAVNPVVEAISGRPAAHWIGKPFAPLVHPDKLPLAWDKFHRILKGEKVEPFELRGHPDLPQPVTMEITLFAPDDTADKINGMMGIARDISARKLAEEKINVALKFNQSTIDALASHLCVLDEQGNILATNHAWEAFAKTGSTPPQKSVGVGSNYLTTCDNTVGSETADARTFGAGIRAVIRGERDSFSLEYPCHSPTQQNWFLATVTRFREVNPLRLVVTHENITERKRAEMAVAESEQEFRMLAESMPQIVWTSKPDGKNNYFNQHWVDYTGLSLAESYGDGWIKPFHPEDRQRAWEAWQQATTANCPYKLECRLLRADGIYRWWLIRGIPQMDDRGNIIKWFGTCTDIEEIKQAEKENARLAAIVTYSEDAIISKNLDGRITSWNRGAEKIFGYAAAEMIGSSIRRIIPAERQAEEDQILAAISLGDAVENIETVWLTRDGRQLEISLTASPIKDGGGNIVGVSKVARDITARRQTAKELEQSHSLLRTTLEATADGILVVDGNGHTTGFNQKFLDLWRIPSALADTKDDRRMLEFAQAQLAEPEIFSARVAELYANPAAVSFEELLFKDGRVIERYSQPQRLRGAVVGRVWSFRDITTRKQAEAKLQISESRLRTWFETPLAGIAITSPTKGWLQVNDLLCQMFGYSREELYAMTWAQITHPDDLPENDAHFDRMLRGKIDGYSMEKRFLRNTGEYLSTEITIRCTRLADGKIDYVVALIQDITRRKQTEQQMRLLNTAMTAAANGVFITDRNGAILWVNPSFTKMTGYSEADAVGQTPRLLNSKQHYPEFFEKVWKHILAGKFWQGEVMNRRKDGCVYFEYQTITPVKDASGQVSHFICVQEDITARKQAEAELIKARDFHLQLLQNAPALIWRAGVDGKCDWFNQTWLAFTGRVMAQEQGDGWAAGVHPDDLDDCVKRYLAHFEKREPFVLEYRLRRHDGEYRWIADHGQPMELPGAGFGGYIGYCYDIHEAKLARELLEQRVVERTREIALLSEVIDHSTVAFSMSNPDGSFITVNEAYARLTGYTRAEILEKKLNWSKELTPPEWRAISAEKLQECLRCRQTVRFEKEYLRKDGSRVPVEVFVQPIFEPEGKLLHLRAFITDITERKKADEALKQAYQRVQVLSEVLNQSELPFAIGYPDGSIGAANQAYYSLVGYTQADFENKTVNWTEGLTPPEWRSVVAEQLQKSIQTQQPVRFEKEYLRKDGRRVPVEMFVQPVFDPAGKVQEYRVFATDIAVRKKTAKELEKALQVASNANRAKSEFLANMSHELRTPLNAVLGFTQLLRQDATLPEPVRDKLKIIHKSGDNLLTILNDILDLAKIEAGRMMVHPVNFSCDEMLHEVVQLFRPPAEAKQLSLLLVTSEVIPHVVSADEEKIRRVLTNLIGNAVKFTQAGGIQVMASATSTGDAHQLRLRFEVKDTGPGIASEEFGHLFRKFEQTSTGQARHSGTGLGLAISQQYAWMLGGSINLQSQVGQGSTFVFEVPVKLISDTEHISRRVKEIARRLAPDQPDCRVLVVDDVEDNRNFLMETLKQAGFDCRPVASGAEALMVAAEWSPQLVLMDTRMPKMDGLETIRQLRTRPESSTLKIISLSAMAYTEDREAAQTAGADDFVSKPVNIPELLEKIGRLLKINYIPVDLDLMPAVPDSVPARPETVAALACLPESWRNQLRDDLLVADFNRVEAAVMNIQPQYPVLAEALRQLVNQFDAEGILNLLADAATRRT